MPDNRKRSQLRRLILSWYRKHARAFPWRSTKNPYRILLSEVMLQQTQTARVNRIYPRFLNQFPGFEELARARISTLIRAWRGMGYNGRVLRLHRAAQIVRDRYKGKLPDDIQDLMALPGIGNYTARAIACFAFGQVVPVVDTNVTRVFSRIFPRDRSAKDAWQLARSILPERNAYEWNQALMELGATVCTARAPRCDDCPIRKLCPSAFRLSAIEVKSRTKEPGRDGIPNRIYRGRIVDVLRKLHDGKTIEASDLGAMIKVKYTRRDRRWLLGLICRLEEDGLLSVRRRGNRLLLSLPT
jgi:A/G-specific adenine glycosylase